VKTHHLDSSILIPYVSAKIKRRVGERNDKAERFISGCRAKIKISTAALAETLRHFRGEHEVEECLEANFTAALPLTSRTARRWARLQNLNGTMGDNDAWVAALAIDDNGIVVGHDKSAFHDRPDVEYIDYMKA